MEHLDDPELDVPHRGRTALVAASVLAVVAVLFVGFLATREHGTERLTSSPIVGTVAPEVTGVDLTGRPFDIDAARGRWVVVNFFATWCVPCIREHPELVEFSARHAAAGDAAVVSVVVETPEREARAFFEDNGGDWPVVIDPEGRTSLDYGMVKVPETFVVAPDGTVVTRLIGGVTADQLDAVIARFTEAAA
jgi:cytochrome c biogenesis protein CcmG/thiol:disulfide interchange protein DsbE